VKHLLLLAVFLTTASALAQTEGEADRVEDDRVEEDPEPSPEPAPEPDPQPEGDPPPDPEPDPEPEGDPPPEPEPEAAPASQPASQPASRPHHGHKGHGHHGHHEHKAHGHKSHHACPHHKRPSEPPQRLELPERDAAYYAVWYGPEWALAVLQVGLLGGFWDALPTAGPAIGPAFDPDNPETLFDPRLDSVIGQPFLQEQIPVELAATGILLAGAAVGTADYLRHEDLHRTHNFSLGLLTAIGSTATVTFSLKAGVGRLRPDFRERYVRAACGGTIDSPLELDCAAVDDGFLVDEATFEKGRRSFPSGHSSLTAATAAYLGLHLGSTFVWGDAVPKHGGWRTASQVGGTLAAGALVASAGYVAASRVTDNRHHPDDVMFGVGIGAAIGAASYLLHFDLDGEARVRGAKVVPLMTDGPGLALQGNF
jgi:membrane-associated phospholipid phosphatase